MNLSISRSGWLYKFVERPWAFFDIDPSNSLCVFFWQMVLSPFMYVIGTMVVIGLVALFSLLMFYGMGILFSTFLHLFFDMGLWWTNSDYGFNWRFVVLSVVAWLLILGAGALRVYMVYRKETQLEEGTYKPSVTIEYIKAKKRKICPFIEFK